MSKRATRLFASRPNHGVGLLARTLLLLVAVWIGGPTGTAAAGQLGDFLGRVVPGAIVPQADRFGPLQQSSPLAPAYAGDRLLGYAYLNTDFANARSAILASRSTCWSASIRAER